MPPDSPTADGGLGAFQVAVRASRLDATEPGIDGGIMDKYSLGVNWYLSVLTMVNVNLGLVDLRRGGVRSQTWILHTRWAILTR